MRKSEVRDAVRNLKSVADFLQTKSRRSKATALNYLTALVHFNNFLSAYAKEKGYTVESILLPMLVYIGYTSINQH